MPRKIEKLMLVFVRAVAVGCIVALPILAWLPVTSLTRTGVGGDAEHFIAYLGTTIVIGLAFQSPRLMVLCVLMIVYAAVLEAGQIYTLGRHASFQNLAFSAAGVLTGGLLLLIARILERFHADRKRKGIPSGRQM